MNFSLRICSNLFASSVKSLTARPLNSMLRRCCGLCSRGNSNINIVSEGREENMSKTLENRILLPSVSTLLSPIVGQYNFPMLSRVSVRVTKNYVLPMDSTHYTCFRPCTTTPHYNYVTLSIRFLLLYEQILDVFINAEFCNTG